MNTSIDLFPYIGLGLLALVVFRYLKIEIRNYKFYLFNLFLICSTQNYITVYIVHSEYINYVPHIFRTAGFSLYLISPLIYLYVRERLFEKGFQKYDLLHAIPGVFYFIDYIPFYLKSGEYKLALIKSLKENGTLNLNMQGYSNDFISHLFVRNFLTVFYASLILILFIRFIKLNSFVFFLQNKGILIEIVFLFYLLLMFSIPPLLSSLNLTSYNAEDFYLILFALLGILSFIFYLPRKIS
ncbi:MAG: hypothetical protein RLZZ417_3002 [Bacteroidota bacterium]|jgi:hypothetical protein